MKNYENDIPLLQHYERFSKTLNDPVLLRKILVANCKLHLTYSDKPFSERLKAAGPIVSLILANITANERNQVLKNIKKNRKLSKALDNVVKELVSG